MNKQNNTNEQANASTTRWVFIPVEKTRVLKREETYVLLKLNDHISAIISSRFVRKKESDTHIFMSVPQDYKIKVRYTEFDEETKRYVVKEENEVNAWYVLKALKHECDEPLPF